MKTKPILFDYVSATGYLYDMMSFRKAEQPGFTFESWASELGFKSRSFMTMILNKERNITAQFIEAFSASMAFQPEEKSYFSLLVQYSQCDSEADKVGYLDRLLEHKGKRKDLVEIQNHQRFLASPFLPKLLVLLSFKDLDRSAEGLASFLKQEKSQVQSCLQTLGEMSLAEVDANQIWFSTKKSFKVPKNLGSAALEKYHNDSLKEAISAQSLPTELRRFRSLLVPLSEPDYQNLLMDIESLINKAVAKYDSDTLDQKRLYKLNLNIFPVTDLLEKKFQPDHKLENETRLFEFTISSDSEHAL